MRGFENKTLDVLMKLLAVVATAMIAAVMLAGCGLVDEDTSACRPDGSNGSGSGSAIGFGVTAADSTTTTRTMTGAGLTATALTRTAEGTMTLDGSGGTESLRERGFGVFACHTGVHPYVSTSTTANLMWNQRVVYDEGTAQWAYSPIVYWPNYNEGLEEYVTFFAYAPHSDLASSSIIDMSLPEETGDPWLTYQLGGTENDWQSRQTDLLYDFRKDLKRDQNVSTTVNFSFRHALACAGDTVIVTAGPRLQQLLMRYAVSLGSDVSLTLKRLTLDYLLTRKGRLVLNSSTQPNWQAVESEDAKVHRYVRLTPNHRLATASPSVCSVTDYHVGSQGVFYIPIEVGDGGQQVSVTATWQMTNGDEGEVTTVVDLSRISEPSLRNGLRLSLELPEPECTGTVLNSAEVGMLICSHGRAHAATDGDLACGGQKVAVVAYAGDAAGVAAPYTHGLALALQDTAALTWCSQTAETCLDEQATDLASALASMGGLTATALLAAHADHTHTAANAASNYRFGGAVSAGDHPVGTSQWFLPSLGQWNLMVKAMSSSETDLSSSQNAGYIAAEVSGIITAAGGDALQSALYWSSTEKSASDAWYVSFENGKVQGGDKVEAYPVRAVLAF